MDSDSLRADYDSGNRSYDDRKGGGLENPRSRAPNQSGDSIDPPRRRLPPAPDQPIIEQLLAELNVVVAGNSKFDAFDHHQTWDTAALLVRYGIPRLAIFRTTDDAARKYLFGGLRKTEKLPFAEIALILRLSRHIPP